VANSQGYSADEWCILNIPRTDDDGDVNLVMAGLRHFGHQRFYPHRLRRTIFGPMSNPAFAALLSAGGLRFDS
jgi:hypothetical protein